MKLILKDGTTFEVESVSMFIDKQKENPNNYIASIHIDPSPTPLEQMDLVAELFTEENISECNLTNDVDTFYLSFKELIKVDSYIADGTLKCVVKMKWE